MKTRTVRTLKAQPTEKDKPVKSTTIEIWTPVPDYDSLRDQDTAFVCVAAELEDALHKSLPGGVYDRLLGLMLQRKSSHFIIAHGDAP